MEHVFGHVSYLRRNGDVLQVTALHLRRTALGLPRWHF
jgi:hypothetical protein